MCGSSNANAVASGGYAGQIQGNACSCAIFLPRLWLQIRSEGKLRWESRRRRLTVMRDGLAC